jgi:hypothetical protein
MNTILIYITKLKYNSPPSSATKLGSVKVHTGIDQKHSIYIKRIGEIILTITV